MQYEFVGRSDVDGPRSFRGHVAVELRAVVVPLERVELRGIQVVTATERRGARSECEVGNIQRF